MGGVGQLTLARTSHPPLEPHRATITTIMTITADLDDLSRRVHRDSVVATPARRHRDRRKIAAVVVTALVVAPIMWTALHAAVSHWIPTGDWAVIELHTRDVGTSATPLVGPYSRFGWNHPGPMLYWFLALPYRLSGSSSASLLVGAALLNIIAVAGTGWFAWRRGGLRLVAISMCGTALVVHHMGTRMLEDPWNPSITVLPLALFMMASWSAIEGDVYGPVVTAVTGSFLVQSHIGFAPIIVPLGIASTIVFARGTRRMRPVVIAAATAALLWSPTLIDQIFVSGNMGDVFRYFATSRHVTAGIGYGIGAVARELGNVGPWLGTLEPLDPVDGHLIPASIAGLSIPLSAFVAAFVAARRCGARSAARFQVVVATATFIGILSIARITPPVFNYLVRWMWPLAMLWWVATIWSASCAVSAALAARRRPVATGPHELPTRVTPWHRTAVLCVATALLIITIDAQVFARAGRVGTPDGAHDIPLHIITTEVLANLPPLATLLIRAAGSNDGSVADALRLALERAGRHVRVDDDLATAYGDDRMASRHPASILVLVVSGPTGTESCSESGRRIIGSWYPTVDDGALRRRSDPDEPPDPTDRAPLYDQPVMVCVGDIRSGA